MEENDDDGEQQHQLQSDPAPSTPGRQEPINELSSAQSHLSTCAAASLASASSVPPPLLSRSSIKSSATQGQEQRSTPSLLIHLSEATQRIHLSPSPSRPRSVKSVATDEGLDGSFLREQTETQKEDGSGQEDASTIDDSVVRTKFLARRLRSAIGEELVLQKDVLSQSAESGAVSADSVAIGPEAGSARSLLVDVSGNKSGHGDTNLEADSGWGWSTFTTLPSSLRVGAALNSLKTTSNSTVEANPSMTSNLEQSREPEAGSSTAVDHSFGSYMKPLDVRRWWASSSGSSRSTSKERPESSSRRNSVRGENDQQSLMNSESSKKGTSKGDLSRPLKGLPSGSFPASSIAKRNKKKREQLLRQGKGKEREADSGTVKGGKGDGPDVIEHDLTQHQFGVLNEETSYPEREYLVLSTAGKPIFVSYVSKARLKRAAATKERRQKHQNPNELDETEEEKALTIEDQSLQDDEDQKAATKVGVLQALISNYEVLGIKELQKRSKQILELPKGTRICYLLKPPLYLAATSRWGEDEITLRHHLEYLHYSIISLVSASKLKRLFDRAANFDLKRLLDGTDGILDNLLTNLQIESTPLYDSLQPLRIDSTLRIDTGAALVPSKDKVRPQDALYALLLTKSGIVTLAKRKRKSIHPVDCHLLINTVYATKAMKEAGAQSWVPICLPKFAPQGYLYAHVSFLEEAMDGDDGKTTEDSSSRREEDDVEVTSQQRKAPADLALVLVTSNPDGFEEMNLWQSTIVDSLRSQKLLGKLTKAIQASQATYSADELRLPGLRHFIFKWRSNLQSTSPQFEDPYEPNSDSHKRLICLYGIAQDYIYRRARSDDHIETEVETATSISTTSDGGDVKSLNQKETTKGQQSSDSNTAPPSPIIRPKSVFADTKSSSLSSSSSSLAPKKKPIITGQHLIKTSSEIVFAWSTPLFEVYLAVGSHLPRNAILNIAKSIVNWVKQEENRLFIASPCLFD